MFGPNSDVMLLLRNPEAPYCMIFDALQDNEVREIFVVTGCTGEYSDRQDWSVGAFLQREEADEYCKMLNDWCVLNECSSSRGPGRYDLTCPLDPGFHCDYTGTNYFVVPIVLKYTAEIALEEATKPSLLSVEEREALDRSVETHEE